MNLQIINTLCQRCNLGSVIEYPQRVQGGFLHEIFKVSTSQGFFVIKQLNLEGFYSSSSDHFISTEKLASLFAANGIHAVHTINSEEPLHEIENLFFIIYPWIEGTILNRSHINCHHAKIIGLTLGKIHSINLKEDTSTEIISPCHGIDWESTVKNAIDQKTFFARKLQDSLDLLYEINDFTLKAEQLFSNHNVISHRDLDSKNVIWKKDTPWIIDWESAGKIHPTIDLFAAALDWSLMQKSIDEKKFRALIEGYKTSHPIHHEQIFYAFYVVMGNWANWLNFNIKKTPIHLLRQEAINTTLEAIQSIASQAHQWITLFSISIA